MYSEKKRLNLFKNYKNLEDNVTHGFLAALKCLKNSTARDIVKKLIGLNLKSNIFYDIQSPSLENDKRFKEAESGYLLGISSLATDIREDASSKKESRADGWISDGEKVILIESKVVSQFSEDQLRRHEEKLRKRYLLNVKLLKSITWQDVDYVLNSYTKRENISEIEKKILLEYRRYLQMEGITLDLEKFFNAVDFEIGKHWYSDEPKKTLNQLKGRILTELDINSKKEQVHETRMNYYWLRLFENKFNFVNWRGTIYLSPDSVSVDVMAFNPKNPNIPEIVNTIKKISERLKEKDRLRTWIYVTNYGKRRNLQSGRDYEYDALNYNLEKSSDYFKNPQNLINYAKSIRPKQMGIKYSISNPGSKSKTYWKEEGKDINHKDAKLLKNPEEVIGKFVEFLNLSLEEMSKL